MSEQTQVLMTLAAQDLLDQAAALPANSPERAELLKAADGALSTSQIPEFSPLPSGYLESMAGLKPPKPYSSS